MLLIYIALIAMLAMAKRPRRKRAMGKYLRGNADEAVGLTTLAARTLVKAAFDEVVDSRAFVSSVVLAWSLADMTQGAGIGPIMVGIAHNDYSAAEVEEYIENTGSWNEGDLVQQEVAKRKIRIVGTFRGANADGTGTMTLNEGKPIRTKCGWILMEGQTLSLWAYNLGANPIATTTPTVFAQGHANLWPR